MTRPQTTIRPHAHGTAFTGLFAECADGRCWACPAPLMRISQERPVGTCTHDCHTSDVPDDETSDAALPIGSGRAAPNPDTTPHVSTADPAQFPRAGSATPFKS